MSNTRQAYVELNFKETSRSGDCNLLEWNESEAVLKDVKLEEAKRREEARRARNGGALWW